MLMSVRAFRYAFEVTGSPDSFFFVQFNSCGSTYDTFLRIMSDDLIEERVGCDDCQSCGHSAEECTTCGLQTILDTDLPPGHYILVVEGFSSNEGDYSVEMICSQPTTTADMLAIACPGAVDGTPSTVTGSTTGMRNNLGNDSPEALFAFTVTTPGLFQVRSPLGGTAVEQPMAHSNQSKLSPWLRVAVRLLREHIRHVPPDRLDRAHNRAAQLRESHTPAIQLSSRSDSDPRHDSDPVIILIILFKLPLGRRTTAGRAGSRPFWMPTSRPATTCWLWRASARAVATSR